MIYFIKLHNTKERKEGTLDNLREVPTFVLGLLFMKTF